MNLSKNKILTFSIFIILTGLFIYLVFIPSVSKINTDFPNYYVSTRMYLEGKEMRTAYDNVLFNRELQLYGINDQIVSYTPYPPITALLFVPLAHLGPLEAKLVWNIINLLLLAGCVILLSKIAGMNFITTAMIFYLSGFALANNFMFGQVYLLVLFFLLLGIYLMQKEKEIPAALFIALSIVLKFFTLFFIFFFIFKKKYRLLVYTIFFTIIIYIPVIYLTGFELNYYYYTSIMPRLGDGWVGVVYASEYQSWLSLLHRWFNYEPALNPEPLTNSLAAFYFLKYVWIFIVLTLAISVLKPFKNNFKLEFSLFCITCLLLLPVNASYQYVVLIPAAAILFKYFTDNKKYYIAASLIILMFAMNSHIQIFITGIFKNTPYYILSYVKLIGLVTFFTVNLIIVLKINSEKLINKRSLKLLTVAGIHIIFLTIISAAANKFSENESEYINCGKNYMYTMPAVREEKIMWAEPVNERFALRSSFGFSYDKHSVYFPVFIDSQHIAFEYIENTQPKQKIVDIISGKERDTSGIRLNDVSLSSDKQLKCFSKEGILYLQHINSQEAAALTSRREYSSFPVFADDSTIVYASDRNRGVSFTSLYKMKIR